MNAAHIHLVAVHLPIVLFPLCLVLLLVDYSRGTRNFQGLTAAILLAASAAAGIAYFSGEGAEELVEHLPGILESTIEAHENVALASLIIGIGAAFTQLASSTVLSASATSRPLAILVVLAASCSFGYVAFLGGKIHHPETGGTSASAEGSHVEHDDDD